VFVFSSRRRHTRFSRDWSSDVCSSDLKKALIINGTTVYLLSAKNPETMDYTLCGIDKALLIDNSGVYRDKKSLGKHLKAKGVDRSEERRVGKEDSCGRWPVD